MRCGCGRHEGMNLIENPDLPYPTERCLCRICTEVRCADRQKVWGRYLAITLPHKVPKRREAVMATRGKYARAH